MSLFHSAGAPLETRICALRRTQLAMHADARPALLAWLSVPARAGHQKRPVLAITTHAEDVFLCFSGFATLCASAPDPVDVHVLQTPPAHDQIRRMGWAEALDPTFINTAAARQQWIAAIKAYCPDDLARSLFGRRGMTMSAAAAHLMVSRRTLGRDRRGAADG